MSDVFSIPILNHIAILRVYPLSAGHHIWTFSILLLRRRALLDSKIAPPSRPRFESCKPLKLAPMTPTRSPNGERGCTELAASTAIQLGDAGAEWLILHPRLSLF